MQDDELSWENEGGRPKPDDVDESELGGSEVNASS